jgi:hypothetical protein
MLEEMLMPVSDILGAVTHAAMMPNQQVDALVAALEPLAKVVAAASHNLDPDAWDWGPIRLAVIEGFAEALRRAVNGTDSSEPQPVSWRRETEPEAFASGVRASAKVLPRVAALEPLKFKGDQAAVEFCKEQQSGLSADGQLDELGWEIYLLARARGGDHGFAFKQAMDGNLRQRERVRHDFLERRSTQQGSPSDGASP